MAPTPPGEHLPRSTAPEARSASACSNGVRNGTTAGIKALCSGMGKKVPEAVMPNEIA
jgi:hypothetical protein